MKFPFRSASDSDDTESGDTTTLHKVTWTEEVEREYTVQRDRFVWSGGAEKEVDHSPDAHDFMHARANRRQYYDVDGELVLEVTETPAYVETLSETTVEKTEEVRRSLWVDDPDGGPDGQHWEVTGATKEVREVND